MINIYRNLDGKGLTIQVVVGRTKGYIHLEPDSNNEICRERIFTAAGAGYVHRGPANNNEILEAMIYNSAEAMAGDGNKAVVDYRNTYASMRALSLELRKRMENAKIVDFIETYHDKDDLPNGVAKFLELERLLACAGILTHAEIHWMDWFTRKHKLLSL